MQLLRFENRISFDYSMWPIAQMVLQDALGEKMTAKSYNAWKEDKSITTNIDRPCTVLYY